jgi:two-component system, NtrC family, sensor kinase
LGKFIAVLAVSFAGGISLMGVFFIHHEKGLIEDNLKERGLALTNNLAYNCEYGMLTMNEIVLMNSAEGIIKQPDVAYCIIEDSEGKQLVSKWKEKKSFIPPEINKKARAALWPITQYISLPGGKNYYEFSVPVETSIASAVKDEEVFFEKEKPAIKKKLGVVRVGVSLARFGVIFEQTKQAVIWVIMLTGLGIAAIATVFLFTVVLVPITELVKATKKIAQGDLTYRVGLKSNDEIGILASSFNKMVDDLRKITVSHDDLAKEVFERARAEEKLAQAYAELKETHEQLLQSAKMASVGLLAGGVAHEINNPLTGVLNNVQLVKMMSSQKTDFNIEDFREFLDVIESSAVRCKNITQSLLDFSRASKGVSQLVSLNEIIEKVISLVEHELKLQNISIQKNLEAGIPEVLGDSQLLQQVVLDIINNAKWAVQKKGGNEGRDIILETRISPDKKQVLLFISDRGVGISRDNLDKIFEPFFTTKEVGEGTGLGLAIVYNIIKAHNGSIEVESELGKGTTFKITLPVAG